MDSSVARGLVAEFPSALNDLPKNSRGDLVLSATVYSEALGRISIISDTLSKLTKLRSFP